jgi:hypothetical protein
MALIKCKECGHDVSTQAKACPGCGAQVKKPSGARLGLFLVAVIGVFALIGIAVRNPSTSDQPASDQQPLPSSQVFTSTTPTTSTSPPQRTLIRSTPGGYKVYSYENTAGETVEEWENRPGKLIGRRFYRPAPPACASLRSLGLNTDRYWRDDGDSVFRCISPVKELGTVADPLGIGSKNGLSYHVDGDAERIHKMLLHLNVNQRHEAKQAHQALAQAAKRLTQEALRTPLPKAAEQAIAAGKPWQGTAKAATLELTREDWPTGKGYTLDFSVRPSS